MNSSLSLIFAMFSLKFRLLVRSCSGSTWDIFPSLDATPDVVSGLVELLVMMLTLVTVAPPDVSLEGRSHCLVLPAIFRPVKVGRLYHSCSGTSGCSRPCCCHHRNSPSLSSAVLEVCPGCLDPASGLLVLSLSANTLAAVSLFPARLDLLHG